MLIDDIEKFRVLEESKYKKDYYCKADDVVFDNIKYIISFDTNNILNDAEIRPSLYGTMMLDLRTSKFWCCLDCGNHDFSYSILLNDNKSFLGQYDIKDTNGIKCFYNDLNKVIKL